MDFIDKQQAVRRSARPKERYNYAHVDGGVVVDEDRFLRLLRERTFVHERFRRLKGHELTLDYIQAHGFDEPLLVETPEGLGMHMPKQPFTVSDVVGLVGGERPVSVMQVSTQQELPDWNLYRWEYYYNHPKNRTDVLNVISLEFSNTPMTHIIKRPTVVDELDWVNRAWPTTADTERRPKVQLYCLMSVKDAFTDFHIDFAGTSVYYHVLSGCKEFLFIRPTREHLRIYEKWSSATDQSMTFLADMVPPAECILCRITAGVTLFIPSGWIHAVHTPEDSLVIGGNFLHSLAAPMQATIDGIEKRTNVPRKFRYPSILRLHWLVLQMIVHELEPLLACFLPPKDALIPVPTPVSPPLFYDSAVPTTQTPVSAVNPPDPLSSCPWPPWHLHGVPLATLPATISSCTPSPHVVKRSPALFPTGSDTMVRSIKPETPLPHVAFTNDETRERNDLSQHRQLHVQAEPDSRHEIASKLPHDSDLVALFVVHDYLLQSVLKHPDSRRLDLPFGFKHAQDLLARTAEMLKLLLEMRPSLGDAFQRARAAQAPPPKRQKIV